MINEIYAYLLTLLLTHRWDRPSSPIFAGSKNERRPPQLNSGLQRELSKIF